MKVDLGQTVVTCGVEAQARKDEGFTMHIFKCLTRHGEGDWGDSRDKAQNDEALRTGNDRLIGVYKDATHPTLMIITEWNRSVTTILFPEEY